MNLGKKFYFRGLSVCLEQIGYIQVPNHSCSRLQVEMQFISNKGRFPRFHILKDGRKQWFIHYDYFKDGDSIHKTELQNKEINKEIERIKYEITKARKRRMAGL